jgi:hypothetical protein
MDATSTQLLTQAMIGAQKINERARQALEYVEAQGALGATPHEVALGLELDINQVRPVCTRLHQLGFMHRSLRTRQTPSGKPSYVYVGLIHWSPQDGECLSKAHRGIGQEILPDVSPVPPLVLPPPPPTVPSGAQASPVPGAKIRPTSRHSVPSFDGKIRVGGSR